MADIKLIDIEKYFGKNYVIRKLNLEIKDGEFLVLLGPSGCGKTTLLNLLSGLSTPDTGEIKIKGQIISNLSEQELDLFRGQNIGIVFQKPHLLKIYLLCHLQIQGILVCR